MNDRIRMISKTLGGDTNDVPIDTRLQRLATEAFSFYFDFK